MAEKTKTYKLTPEDLVKLAEIRAKQTQTAGTPATAKANTASSSPSTAPNIDLLTSEWKTYITQRSKGKNITQEDVKTWLASYLFDDEENFIKDPFTNSVPGLQKQGNTGSFGTRDWWGNPELRKDFIRRQGPLIEQYEKETGKKWDPTVLDLKDKDGTPMSSSMLWFEKEYNKQAQEKGQPNYNFGKQGKFGKLSYSVPSLYDKETPIEEQTSRTAEVISTNEMQDPAPIAPAEWWLQDKIKTAGAAGDFLRLKKYLPWAPKVAPVVPTPTFTDPTRELAANAEQMQIGTQGAGVFAGPQRYAASFSNIQGKGAANAANIMSRYNNQNVGIANQFEGNKARIMNRANEMNTNISRDLYDKTTIANQQFDNAKAMARQELRSSYIDAITNRAQTQALNTIYPNYQIDPTTGGLVNFYKGDNATGANPQDQFKQQVNYFNQVKTADPSVTWKDIFGSKAYDQNNQANSEYDLQREYNKQVNPDPYGNYYKR